MTQPEALRLADLLDERPRDSLDFLPAKAAAELRRLHEENKAMRFMLSDALHSAEWRDKHIYPVQGASYQNWLLQVYLQVPLSASDKSPEAALERAISAARKRK